MVTVSSYSKKQNADGEDFIVLVLTGDLEFIQSKEGRLYATVKKANIASTFSEDVAKTMIGKQLPGSIDKQECEPYDYVVPETGKILELNYRWVYVPDNRQDENTVISNAVRADVNLFSTNGSLVEA